MKFHVCPLHVTGKGQQCACREGNAGGRNRCRVASPLTGCRQTAKGRSGSRRSQSHWRKTPARGASGGGQCTNNASKRHTATTSENTGIATRPHLGIQRQEVGAVVLCADRRRGWSVRHADVEGEDTVGGLREGFRVGGAVELQMNGRRGPGSGEKEDTAMARQRDGTMSSTHSTVLGTMGVSKQVLKAAAKLSTYTAW